MSDTDTQFRAFPRIVSELLTKEAAAAHVEISRDTLAQTEAILENLMQASKGRLSRDVEALHRMHGYAAPPIAPATLQSARTPMAFARMIIQNTRDEGRSTVALGDVYRALVEAGRRCGWWPIC